PTARLPSNAGGCAALVVSDPRSAFVFASKLPPIVIGHLMLTAPCVTRHGPAAVAMMTSHRDAETQRTVLTLRLCVSAARDSERMIVTVRSSTRYCCVMT